MRKDKRKEKFDVGRTLTAHKPAVPRPVNGQTGPPAPLYADEKTGGTRRTIVRVLYGLLGAVMLAAIIIGVWDTISISRAASKTFGSGNVLSVLTPTSLKGSGNGRVNVLLVGYSVDDPGHPGASLTDSLILLSLSTRSHTGYMLSIPRDLYVKIPGFYGGKINEVYKDGGMPLLEQVIGNDFGMSINYYALVDYAAVKDTVNALGGVWINIQSPDPRGLYDPNISAVDGGPLNLTNGWHKLNGQTALNLTRARGDPAPDGRVSYGFPRSDFDRTQHQRQLLTAIKAQLKWTLVLNPLENGRVFSAIGNNIKTDIKLSEVRPLFSLFKNVPDSQLQSFSLRNLNGKNYLVSSQYEGDTLSPAAGTYDFSDIDAALNQLNQN